jgi:hypothetical protein
MRCLDASWLGIMSLAFIASGCATSSAARRLDPAELCDGTDEIKLRANLAGGLAVGLDSFTQHNGVQYMQVSGNCQYLASGPEWGLTRTGILEGELLHAVLRDLQYEHLPSMEGTWNQGGCYDSPVLTMQADSLAVRCYCHCQDSSPDAARALGTQFATVIERLLREGTYWDGPLRILVVRRPMNNGEVENISEWPLASDPMQIAIEYSELWNDGELNEERLEGVLVSSAEEIRAMRALLQSGPVRRSGAIMVRDVGGLTYDLYGRDEIGSF